MRLDGKKRRDTVAKVAGAHHLLVTQANLLYFTTDDGSLWLLRAGSHAVKVAHGLAAPSALAISPDKAWLFVAQANSRMGYSFRILADGTLDSGEPFFDFVVPTGADGSGAAALAIDSDGRIYAATAAGIQIFDHNGRVTAVLPLPGGKPATGLAFGGAGFHTLYVSDGETVFSRVLRVTGITPATLAVPVPNWGAG